VLVEILVNVYGRKNACIVDLLFSRVIGRMLFLVSFTRIIIIFIITGSSGGEAAGISSGCSIFGIGSDFAGSIRIPANFNGIFGHKPTMQTTSAKGHVPFPKNVEVQKLLSTGILARHSQDLKPIMKLISTGIDFDSPVDLDKLKYYYLDGNYDLFLGTSTQAEIKTTVLKAAKHFDSLGYKVEKVELTNLKYAMICWFASVKTKDKPQLPGELANGHGEVGIGKEALKTLVGVSKHTLPIIMFGAIESANPITYKGALHSAVLDQCKQLQDKIEVWFLNRRVGLV